MRCIRFCRRHISGFKVLNKHTLNLPGSGKNNQLQKITWFISKRALLKIINDPFIQLGERAVMYYFPGKPVAVFVEISILVFGLIIFLAIAFGFCIDEEFVPESIYSY